MMLYGYSNHFGGVQIVESWKMVDRTEDWSRVRSPSRAERRRRLGHRQNIDIRETSKKEAITIDGGRTYIMHPVMAAEFRRQIPAR
jgi:hypothetical protein